MSVGPGVFRREAVEHQNQRPLEPGRVLRLTPAWMTWVWRLVLGFVLIGALFVLVARVGEFGSGPAVVRLEGRLDVTTPVAGTVDSVLVQPGRRVAAGDPLVQLRTGPDDAGAVARIEKEFELELVKVLRDPSAEGPRQTLTRLRSEIDLARGRVEQRLMRAVRSGVVGDLRVRPGRYLAIGEFVLSIVPDDASVSVLALLPGDRRPYLQPGQPMRLELAGFRNAPQDLIVADVSSEVIGPAEIRRYLGSEIGDAIPITKPVVLVRAPISSRTFLVDGKAVNYFEGMVGQAEVRLRTRSVIATIVPALEKVAP